MFPSWESSAPSATLILLNFPSVLPRKKTEVLELSTATSAIRRDGEIFEEIDNL
jgi:hypothetical protein